jgi:hypothetical protein
MTFKLLDTNLILLAQIPPSIVGSKVTFYIAINSYMTETTPIKYRALRFMVYELMIFTGKS